MGFPSRGVVVVPMRRPKGCAVLKNLPEEKQIEIVEYARGKTLRQISEWLIANGIGASDQMVGRFLSWRGLRDQLREHTYRTNTLLDLLKDKVPTLPEEKFERYMESLFSQQALTLGKPELYLEFRRAKHRERVDKARLALLERRIKIMEDAAKRDLAVKAVEHSGLPQDERDRRIREIFEAPQTSQNDAGSATIELKPSPENGRGNGIERVERRSSAA